MTASTLPSGADVTSATPTRWLRLGRELGRWVVVYAAALVVFGAFLVAKGANPFTVYSDVWRSTVVQHANLAEILVKAAPLVLAGLAVAVPARAGLVNVGGEGQIVIGAICASGAALALDARLPGALMILVMIVAAAVGGAAWAGLAVLLKLGLRVNEAITTLLLNYVAIDLMLYLVYAPWKDPHGSGQPATRALAVAARLPLVGTSKVNQGILLAGVAAVVMALVLQSTTWGFQLRVVGGNPEAARRAGLAVGPLLLSAMLVGGALAGLAGMVHFAGSEFKLRPGMTANFGYIAFLASWLARHKPGRVVLASLLLAAIAVAGDSLQIDANLPAASVNILMALVLLAVMGGARREAVA